MRVLTLDAALDGCSAGLVVDGALCVARFGEGGRGQAAVLPLLTQQVLAGTPAVTLARIAVTVGPGSFTGIRAALALAHGIGLAAGVPVVGVTVGAALATGADVPDGWRFWTVVRARSRHVFLQVDGTVRLCSIDALPEPGAPLVVAGNAAEMVADQLGGWTVRLSGLQAPDPASIAQAAASCPCAAAPLYVEPPRTTHPAA